MENKRKKAIFVLPGIIMLMITILFSVNASATSITNYGFETGDLTGWNVQGEASVVTNYTGYDSGAYAWNFSPKDGDYFALLGDRFYTGASIISQEFNIYSGETISGFFAFDARGLLKLGNDSASVQIFDSAGNSVLIGPSSEWYSDTATVGSNGITPWKNWSWTASQAGTYTINYILRNTTAGYGSSFAVFDAYEISSTPAPEPSTLFLIGGGLLGLAGVSRKNQQ